MKYRCYTGGSGKRGSCNLQCHLALHGSHVTFRRRHRHTGQPLPSSVMKRVSPPSITPFTSSHRMHFPRWYVSVYRQSTESNATLVIFAQTDSILTGGERVACRLATLAGAAAIA